MYQFLLGSALAAAAAVAGPGQVDQQPTVVVTASAIPQTADATLADVSVIDRADIEASGAADIKALLQLQAGIDITRAGGPGTQTSLFLRGTNTNHVLVLIDGMRVSSLNTGAFAWEQLPLGSIERIEIVRGPRATVWGSDAVGGVIQIFTRKIDGGAAALRYGSHQDAAVSAGIGSWNDGSGFSIHAGIRDVEGFSAQNPEGFGYNPDNDGLENHYANLRGAIVLGRQSLTGQAWFSDSEIEFDQGQSHNIEQSAEIKLHGPLADGWSHQLILGAARESLSTPSFASRFSSKRRSLAWRNRLDLGSNQQLTFGAELLREEGENIFTGDNSVIFAGERRTHSLFAGWYGHQGRLDWELAARHDDNDVFGEATTGSAALGVRIVPSLRLMASWGEGFRAPNLYEQYSPGFGGYYAGNPDLVAERSHSSELALEWQPGDASSFRLSHYRTEIRDLISFTGGELFQAENIARARITGTELKWSWQPGIWSITGNATWQDPRNLVTDSVLLRRPRRKANLVVTRDFGTRFNAGLEALAVDARPELGGPLPGYGLLNARFHAKLSDALDLSLRADNLLDREYTELRGFNTPGRSFLLELRWHDAN